MSPNLGSDKTNYAQSLMHMIKGNLGTGILAMPISFKHCGLLTASIGLPILCIIATYCVHLLIRSSQHLENKMKWTNLDYAALAKGSFKAGPAWIRSWSGFMNRIVDAVLIICQFGICCVYLVFIADNIETILKPLPQQTESSTTPVIRHSYEQHETTTGAPLTEVSLAHHHHNISNHMQSNATSASLVADHEHHAGHRGPMASELSKGYIFIAMIPFLMAVSFIRTLRRLSLLSAMANFLQVFGIILILVNLIQGMPEKPEVEQVAPFSELALGFGSAMFAFEGISVVLPIYTRMKRPEQMGGTFGIVNVSYCLLLILYCAVGALGYLRFGFNVKDSITLNLAPSLLNNIIRAAFAASIFLTYPLQFYVPTEIMWNWTKERIYADAKTNPKKSHKLEYLFRGLLVIFTFLLAISVPMLNLLMDLVGSISGTALSITLPAVIHLVTFWEDVSGNTKLYMIVTDVALIVFSLMAGGSGAFFSVLAIFRSFEQET